MLRLKTFAIALIIGLLSTSCGGTDELEGEAIRVAVQSDQFCNEAYSDIWGDFASDAMRPDNAQSFAISIQRILATIPDDAPRELRRVYETFEEIALLSIDLPLGDPADMDDAAQGRYQDIYAAIGELEGFDQDVISSYVASACPAQYANRGFLTTGTTGQSQGTNDTEAARSQGASATAVPTPEPTPDPTPEPTPIPVVTTELDVTLNVGRFDGTDIELFAVQATNGTPESVLAGDPVADPDGQNWLILHVGFTNTFTNQIRFSRGAFRLIGPDGRPAVEEDRLDDRGRDNAFAAIGTREFVEGFVTFPTGGLIDDLSDWILVVDQDDGVPEIIPLSTTYTTQYPYELTVGGTGMILQEPGTSCSSPIGIWDAEVTEAFVHVDPLTGSGTRVPSGERWVTVRLFATNVAQLTGDIYCDLGAEHGFNMDVRLAVDGRSTGNIGSYDYDSFQVESGESTDMQALFRIDADATTLALITGPDNEVIVEWQVDIPLMLDR